MDKEELQKYIKRKIDRFKNINSQHQATINEYCSDVRQMRRIIQENEELIEKLENEMLFGKDVWLRLKGEINGNKNIRCHNRRKSREG